MFNFTAYKTISNFLKLNGRYTKGKVEYEEGSKNKYQYLSVI